MKTRWIAVLSMALAGPALAQIPKADMPFYLLPTDAARIEALAAEGPRAKGPTLKEAVDLVRAVLVCSKDGNPSILVTDSVGVPVAVISGDGAGERSMLVNYTKAATVVRYKVSSGEVFQRVKTDARLAAEVRDDPKIGAVRPGGFPLIRGGEMVGTISLAGPTGTDEDCTKYALARAPLR